MADDDRHGLEGDTGRKPLPRPDREFEELEDSFSERGSSFFQEYAEEYVEEAPARPEPEDFGFDDIARDDEPAPGAARGRTRASRGRGRSRSGGAGRSGRASGGARGGGGGRTGGGARRPRSAGGGMGANSPLVRMAGVALFVVLLVIVMAFVIQDCRRDAVVDSYKQYVNSAAQVTEQSAKQGEQLLVIMQNKDGENAAALQRKVRALGNQAEQLTTRATDLSPPDRLADADRALVLALQYRENGLKELAENLPQIIQQSDERLAARTIKESMQKFLASDVLIRDSFNDVTSAALRDEDITNVAPPDDAAASFLKGALDRYATDAGARTLVTPLRRQRGTAANGNNTDNADGNLRGTRLVSVVADPSGTQLSTSGASIAASSELQWRITVLNGGDFVETDVKVTVTLTYPSAPNTPADAQESTIATIEPDKEAVVTIPGPPQDAVELGQRGSLRVEVEPVQGEQNVSNNSAEYPVTITFG